MGSLAFYWQVRIQLPDILPTKSWQLPVALTLAKAAATSAPAVESALTSTDKREISWYAHASKNYTKTDYP